MKESECPNCGSANPIILSEGEYRCSFCDTPFRNEELINRKKAHEKKLMRERTEQSKLHAISEQAKATKGMGKRVLIFVAITLITIFGFIFYMAKKSMDESKQQQQDLIKSFEQNTK